MDAHLVSIVIPTKNRAAYLAEAINSVYTQSYQNFEVLVVDDGSTDHTPDIIQRYDKRLHYFRQSAKGVAAARNYGIHQAKGTYVAFLDDDDTFLPQKLETCIRHFAAYPQICWLCSGFAFVDAAGQPLPRPPVVPQQAEMTLHEIALFTFISSSTVVVRLDSLIEAGGFPENAALSEDYHLWARLLSHGKGAALPQVLATYRLHAGNTALPYRVLLKENKRIIDLVLASGAKGLWTYTDYRRNLHRIVGESLWAKRRYADYARFRLEQWCGIHQ